MQKIITRGAVHPDNLCGEVTGGEVLGFRVQ